MAEEGRRGPGRPPDPELRSRIVSAGWDLFLRNGVEATPVDAIARAAGVSKVTLYRHFADKTELFAAGVQAEQDRLQADRELPWAGDAALEERLVSFGEATMQYLTAGDAVDFYAVLVGDLRRHPDLARAFYDAGPGSTHVALAAMIRSAAEVGELEVDDAEAAAERLFGMWQGFSNFQLALGAEGAIPPATIGPRVREAVRVFLLAYGADADGRVLRLP